MSTANTMLPVRRAYRLLWALQGHSFDGLRLAQIARALDGSMTATLRLLETAADEGVVERIPGKDEYWRLTPRLVQVANAHGQEMDKLRRRMDEMDQRYTRQP